MTEDQVIAFLRTVRFSDPLERNAGRTIGINTIASAAGISGKTIYQICNGKRPSRPILNRLRAAITSLTPEWLDQTPRAPHHTRALDRPKTTENEAVSSKSRLFKGKCPLCGHHWHDK